MKDGNKMGGIIIQDREISFKDIQGGNWPRQKDYFEDALLFCRDWLRGRENFELKTSGSTGPPKGISIHRGQMISSAKATGAFFDMQPGQNLLCCLNTSMIGGKMMLVRAMEWDCLLDLVESSSNPLLGFPAEKRFDFAAMVPLQLEACLENKKTRPLLDRINKLIIGGAPISPSLRKQALSLNANIYQTYGMTETVSHIALANIKSSGPLVYQTLPGVRIRQNDDQRLQIAAPMVHEEWLLTNDRVEILSDSSFIWKGRADFTINSGGLKIQPEEVEEKINETIHQIFPNVRFFIGSREDAKLGQKMILILEDKGNRSARQEKLLSLLRDLLPKYHNPKEIYFVYPFVETPSGKVNRKETEKLLDN